MDRHIRNQFISHLKHFSVQQNTVQYIKILIWNILCWIQCLSTYITWFIDIFICFAEYEHYKGRKKRVKMADDVDAGNPRKKIKLDEESKPDGESVIADANMTSSTSRLQHSSGNVSECNKFL